MDKPGINVSVLGATGMVGQNYIKLLADHPWFNIIDVAASPRSAGKRYAQAVQQRWYPDTALPEAVKSLIVRDVRDISAMPDSVSCVFSAMDLPEKEDTRKLEFEYAHAGFPFISNSSANRWTEDVPVLIPEINHQHVEMIGIQQENRGLSRGFVISKPNCSIQSFLTPVHALERAGYPVSQIIVTTLQALSGGGINTIKAEEMKNNIMPDIRGEEAKTEREPLKVLGSIAGNKIILADHLSISATTTRVPVLDGHTASLNLKFQDKIPARDEILQIWAEFRSRPQELELPFAPEQAILYSDEDMRPQPRLDVMNDKGMAVTIGRLRKDSIFDYKFVTLSHNTIRGAAGGAILSAELLVKAGLIR